MTTLVEAINRALAYRSDATWAFHMMLGQNGRDHMDTLLVRVGHPLAFEPGTQEARFRALHAANYRFVS